jgi:hypothetical protein
MYIRLETGTRSTFQIEYEKDGERQKEGGKDQREDGEHGAESNKFYKQCSKKPASRQKCSASFRRYTTSG